MDLLHLLKASPTNRSDTTFGQSVPHAPCSAYVLSRVVVGHMLIQGVCNTLIGPTALRKRFVVGHFGGKEKKHIFAEPFPHLSVCTHEALQEKESVTIN